MSVYGTYTSNASDTNLYPDSNTAFIAGSIWLPRVYGKDLTAFEIASSGRIAVTLNDVYSLDITRSNYINTLNFVNTVSTTTSNSSLELSASSSGPSNIYVRLDAYSNNIQMSAPSNINLYTPTSSLSMGEGKLSLQGDLQISGSIITSTPLAVSDTQITLASVSNFSPITGPFDGSFNTGGGIRIDGLPEGYDSNAVPEETYDKTFTWNYGNTGIGGLGTAEGLSNESYWEFKGGSMRMTHQRVIPMDGSNIVRDTSFSFRINELDELELCKRWWVTDCNDYVTKRVAKFGRIL